MKRSSRDEEERLVVELPADDPASRPAEAISAALVHREEQPEPGRGEPPAPGHGAVLFAQAEAAYLADHDKKPIESFYPIVAGTMALQTFRNKATAARWREKRERLWAHAQRRLVERLEGQVVRLRLKEMSQLEAARSDFLDLITPKVVEVEGPDGEVVTERRFKIEPKSLGEAVRSFKDVTLLLEMARRNMMLDLDLAVPPVEGTVEEDNAGDLFSQDELATLAHGLLRKRAGLEEEG